MGWKDDQYFYTSKTLRTIAENYVTIYNGLPLNPNEPIVNGILIAEYKADFDMALNNIGRGKWTGKINSPLFKYYQHFGRSQILVISDILGIVDNELQTLGFQNIPKLKGFAYYLMKCHLNGGPNWDKD